MARVALLRCDDYSITDIKDIIIDGLSLIGFDPGLMKDKRVALKPNLLSPSNPETSVVTHPVLFRAVLEIVLQYGGRPILVESPAIVSVETSMKKAGYEEFISSSAIEIADMKTALKVHCPACRTFKYHEVCAALTEIDMIINLPKFKTHGLTYITGAVKNLFGLVPGMRKSQMHMKVPDKDEFSEYILDLYTYIRSCFDRFDKMIHIMDAVSAMEGQGPGRSGRPRKMSSILVGREAVAVDYVATKVAGLDVEKARTITSGFERGLGVSSPDDISVVGEDIDNLRLTDFVAPGIESQAAFWGKIASKYLKGLVMSRPVPVRAKCSLCYRCMQICPAGAIATAEDDEMVPRFDYGRCIRCFCCMEICPEGAIRLKKGMLQGLIGL